MSTPRIQQLSAQRNDVATDAEARAPRKLLPCTECCAGQAVHEECRKANAENFKREQRARWATENG